MSAPYRIAIVVDPEFGDGLLDVGQRMHVWACDTALNRAAAERLHALLPVGSGAWGESGVTRFDWPEGSDPEAMVLALFDDIDTHHGELGHDPAWSEIEVYGVRLTEPLRQLLQEYAVDRFEETPSGFRCFRPEG